MSPVWFYAKAGASIGPVSLDELRLMLSSGELDRKTLVWSDSLPNWIAAQEVAALRPSPPPPACV